MASKKDMRRADLIVPYAEPEKSKDEGDMSSTLSSTLPMAAIFTRNKMIGWVAVVFAIQAWLAETAEQRKTSTTPAYFQVGMSSMHAPIPSTVGSRANSLAVMSLLVTYSSMFLPPPPARPGQASGTEAFAAVPPSCSSKPSSKPPVKPAKAPFPPHLNRKLSHWRLDTSITPQPPTYTRAPTDSRMSIENLKTFDPFAEADEDTGQVKQTQQDYIHIRIQQRNGRKTLTTVQGLPKKFDQKKILKVIKKKFACNGTIVSDAEMGEVVQLQGDQRKDVQDFLTDKKEGLGLDAKTIKVHGF
ncbi:translation initiation factor [Bipolaris maydis]|nr:translation initiation factor [Bipolaris maydis]KAJ6269562.1 translation initiation factor [Bipolaris maydis]KAJ6280626.1 translation initiation factor [Bipolaris maydis]